MTGTARLTVGQAVVRFLAAQRSERDGTEQPFFGGCSGIFGHGNLAGIGQALLEAELGHGTVTEERAGGSPGQHGTPGALRYYQARNEQAMVHTAVAYARMRNRLAAWACTSSVGPGATNMVTGAALATINRLPVLLLPGEGEVWLVGLVPDSGVSITHHKALQAIGMSSDQVEPARGDLP